MPPTPPVIAAWIRCVKAGLDEQNPTLLYEAFMTNIDRVFRQRPYPALHLDVRRLAARTASDYEPMVTGDMGADAKAQVCRAMAAYLWLVDAADPNIVTHARPGFQQQTRILFERMKEFMQYVRPPIPRGLRTV